MCAGQRNCTLSPGAGFGEAAEEGLAGTVSPFRAEQGTSLDHGWFLRGAQPCPQSCERGGRCRRSTGEAWGGDSELGPREQVGTCDEVRQILGRGERGTRAPRLEPHPGSIQRDQAQWTASIGGVSARGLCSQVLTLVSGRRPHRFHSHGPASALTLGELPLTASCFPCSHRWAK